MVLVLGSQFANFILKKTPYDLKNLAEIIDATYTNSSPRTKYMQKTGFSASTLGYSSGTCPRRWVMAFEGAEFNQEQDAIAIDRMSTGTDAHERIQRNLHQSNITLDVEWEFWNEDPPMHGFVDIILRDFHGFDIVVEIKTTRTEAFQARRAKAKGPDYQVLQLLLYMYSLNIKHGLLLYEDKNDHNKLLIPVTLDEINREKIDKVVEWMRLVYKTYLDGKLPERPYRKNSKICQSCPLLSWCGKQGDGDIKIEPLEFEA